MWKEVKAKQEVRGRGLNKNIFSRLTVTIIENIWILLIRTIKKYLLNIRREF